MKKSITILFFFFAFLRGNSQTFDEWFNQKPTQIKYLLEQVAKLEIYLDYVKKGYKIADIGLSTISAIKNGDINLHTAYFNNLKEVNPQIRNYFKVAEIATFDSKILSEYSSLSGLFSSTTLFNTVEKTYLKSILNLLIEDASKIIESLTLLLTNTKFQMRDNERLQQIDKLYDAIKTIYETTHSVLFKINSQLAQRIKIFNDLELLKNEYSQ